MSTNTDRLAREAVIAAIALHNPIHQYPGALTACTDCGQEWPCKTVMALGEAEEAISMEETA